LAASEKPVGLSAQNILPATIERLEVARFEVHIWAKCGQMFKVTLTRNAFESLALKEVKRSGRCLEPALVISCVESTDDQKRAFASTSLFDNLGEQAILSKVSVSARFRSTLKIPVYPFKVIVSGDLALRQTLQ
jgi:hypothetical protein